MTREECLKRLGLGSKRESPLAALLLQLCFSPFWYFSLQYVSLCLSVSSHVHLVWECIWHVWPLVPSADGHLFRQTSSLEFSVQETVHRHCLSPSTKFICSSSEARREESALHMRTSRPLPPVALSQVNREWARQLQSFLPPCNVPLFASYSSFSKVATTWSLMQV